MFTPYWWQRYFARYLNAYAPCRRSGRSTVRVQLELLEIRNMPATIYVTGNVTNSVSFTDPGRFNDGSVSPLTHLSGSTYLATNLRSAVVDAQALRGGNTILLEAAHTYTLGQGQVPIKYGPATALTIKTITNAGFAAIDAQESSRVFEVYGGGLTNLRYLNVTDGNAPSPAGSTAYGGAILNEGTLVLFNDQITNSTASGYGGGEGAPQWGAGGGIYNDKGASLTMTDSTVDSNTAIGGDGLFNAGGGEGGGLFVADGSGPVSITASTFSNNIVNGGNSFVGGAEGVPGPGLGGGIGTDQTQVTIKIINSTFAGNAAYGGAAGEGPAIRGPLNPFDNPGITDGSSYGGAIFASNQTSFRLVNDTIVGNAVNANTGPSNGGGIANFGGDNTVALINTLIAQNQNNPAGGGTVVSDVFGSFDSLGHNFVSALDGSTGFTAAGDQTGTSASPLDPGLDPAGLANNGGPTQTIALEAYSPAINKGDNRVTTPSSVLSSLGALPLTTDQRGPHFARKVDGTVDIGAYEFQMNLNKFYAITSSRTASVTLTVTAPGLLLGSNAFPLPLPSQSYEVELAGSVPGGGTRLTLNPDGSFTFTVPPSYRNLASFQFRVLVTNGTQTLPTNLIFTATIQVNFHGFGRGAAGDYLGLVQAPTGVEPP